MNIISVKNLKDNNYILSSSVYDNEIYKDKQKNIGTPVIDFINNNYISNKGNILHGRTVTSFDRCKRSKYKLLKSRVNQRYSSIPVLSKETTDYIIPDSLKGNGLKKNDIIMTAVGNAGKTSIITKNSNNDMLNENLFHFHCKKYISKYGIRHTYTYFILAYLMSDMYQEQLNSIVTSKYNRATSKIFKIQISPYVVSNRRILSYLERRIVVYDKTIRNTFCNAINLIDSQLHFRNSKQSYNVINISNIIKSGRMDSSFYNGIMPDYWKMFYNKNSKYITQLGFEELHRGQNMEKSALPYFTISNKSSSDNYKLIRAKDLSAEGFPIKKTYISSPYPLKKFSYGDILFGSTMANRSFIVPKSFDKGVTTIDFLIIRQKDDSHINPLKVTVKYLLDYYDAKGILNCISAGDTHKHLIEKYWKYIKFPIMPLRIQKKLYYKYIQSLRCWYKRNKFQHLINNIISNKVNKQDKKKLKKINESVKF